METILVPSFSDGRDRLGESAALALRKPAAFARVIPECVSLESHTRSNASGAKIFPLRELGENIEPKMAADCDKGDAAFLGESDKNIFRG